MKHDIILTMLNSKYVHSSLAPWCLFSSVKENLPYIKMNVYESTINSDPQEILNYLLSKNSRVYGFCVYIWNVKETLFIAKKIKELRSNAIILLGGPEVSYCAEKLLKSEKYIDYIISGEGEEPLCNFLKALSEKGNMTKVEGLYGKDFLGEPFISNKEYPSPYTKEYLENLNGKIAYIETSRGCPFSCAFCLSGRCGSVRYFSLDRIFDEIITLANAGIKTLKFVDRTFNANPVRSNKILDFLILSSGKLFPDDVCFHFEIAGDILKEETFKILKKAPCGLFQLEIGLQTFNENTLKKINRKTNTEKLIENIKRLISFDNMHIHIDLIAGLPLEDLNSFRDTFNKGYYLKADMLQLGFLKLLHGAPMREESELYPCEYKSDAPYEVISTPYISQNELEIIKIVEEVLEKLYNSNRFITTLEYALSETGENPFDFFLGFGKYADIKRKLSLDELTNLLFKYLTEEKALCSDKLRDFMCIDRLSSNKSGKMPAFLKKEDAHYKSIKKYLSEKGINDSFVILYTQNKIAFSDYKSAPLKNGNFKLIYKEKDEFLQNIL